MNKLLPPPTLTGPRTRAWRYDITISFDGIPPGTPHATIVQWLIEAPWAHPMWHSYFLSLVHLRPVLGSTHETLFYLNGATHEVTLMAVDPEWEPTSLTSNPLAHCLMPMNYAGQFIEPTDQSAEARVRAAVQDVVDGVLSPDTDYLKEWCDRFGTSMLKGQHGKQ